MGKKVSKNPGDKPASPGYLPGQDGAASSSSGEGPSGRGAVRGGAAPRYWMPSDSWHPSELYAYNPRLSSRKTGSTVETDERRFEISHLPPLARTREGWEDAVLETLARKDPAYGRALKRQCYEETCLEAARRVVAYWCPDIRLELEGFEHPHLRENKRARSRMKKKIVEEAERELRDQGYKIREIAAITGRDKDTVNKAVA
jgi:hypothetical protein